STSPSMVAADKCKSGTEGGKEYVAGRLASRWQASSRVTVDLAADVTRDNSEVGPATSLYVGRPAAYVLNGNVFGTASGSPYISYSPYGNYAQDTFTKSPFVSYENYTEVTPRDGSGTWSAPLKGLINSWGISGTITAELLHNINLTSITDHRTFDAHHSSGDRSPFNTGMQANRVHNH
ncbi:hypothetical protein OY671_009789, partial [Metschnikowia pulcherrima]